MKSDKEPFLWPLALLGILAVASWFRSKPKTPIRQAANPVCHHNNTADCGDKSKNDPQASIVLADPYLPSTPPQCGHSNEKRKHWLKRWKPYFLLVNIFTLAAVVWYACITRRVWKEMQKQTETSQKQLEVTERPWIKGEIAISTDLTFDANGNMNFSVLGTLQNAGRGVANEATINVKLIATVLSGEHASDNYFREPIRQQAEFCDDISRQPFDFAGRGFTLFQNDVVPQPNIGLTLPKADIDKDRLPYEGHPGKNVLPFIIGCVDYQYANWPTHHQTRFIYDVMCINPKEPNHPSAIDVTQSWPRAKVLLVPHAFGGQYAY